MNLNPAITIIHPSYKRPELAVRAARNWLNKAKNPENIEYILCLATPDPTTNDYLKQFENLINSVDIIFYEEANMVKQVNYAATIATGNLLIDISDDFDCPQDWDEKLLQSLEGKEDYIVKTQDGIQKFIMTLPIMDSKYYERFGFIYHPDYNHMFGDEELACVGKLLNKTVTLDLLFPHLHYITGAMVKDETNIRNDGFYPIDKITFNKRKARNFDLDKLNEKITNSSGEKKLSILIPSLTSRATSFNKLIKQLNEQINAEGVFEQVEIIAEVDNKQATIGAKRNKLLQRAIGEYIAFIDDDDRVSDNYISLLLKGIESGKDCCSLNGIFTMNGGAPKIFKHSIEYTGWHETPKAYLRFPNHLNCVKASIAKQMKFPKTNFGEDKDYSDQLFKSGLLKSEFKIEQVIYFYDFIQKK